MLRLKTCSLNWRKKMFKALVKTRLAALWASFYTRTRSAKNGKKPSKIGGIGIAILLIYAAIVFAGMFSAMFFGIAELYHAQGIGWLYFALAGILAAGVLPYGLGIHCADAAL